MIDQKPFTVEFNKFGREFLARPERRALQCEKIRDYIYDKTRECIDKPTKGMSWMSSDEFIGYRAIGGFDVKITLDDLQSDSIPFTMVVENAISKRANEINELCSIFANIVICSYCYGYKDRDVAYECGARILIKESTDANN